MKFNLFKKISRRKFLKGLAAGAGISLLGTTGYSVFLEPNNVIFERYDLEIPNLGEKWAGKKLIQVSDIHSSEFVRENFIGKIFDRINDEKPDIIVFTGDYVTGRPGYMEAVKNQAKKLKAKIKAAIIGNHDRWTSETVVVEGLKKAGFRVLIDDVYHLGNGPNSFKIVGMDDLWTGNPNFEKTLREVDLSTEACILLSHNPDVFYIAASMGVPVVLAGHTHGGQVKLPFIGAPILPSGFRFEKGFYTRKRSLMYVNRGLGLIAPPVRFRCPPEVAVFTLRTMQSGTANCHFQ